MWRCTSASPSVNQVDWRSFHMHQRTGEALKWCGGRGCVHLISPCLYIFFAATLHLKWCGAKKWIGEASRCTKGLAKLSNGVEVGGAKKRMKHTKGTQRYGHIVSHTSGERSFTPPCAFFQFLHAKQTASPLPLGSPFHRR